MAGLKLTLNRGFGQDGLLDGLGGVAVVVVVEDGLVGESAAFVPPKFGATVLKPDLKTSAIFSQGTRGRLSTVDLLISHKLLPGNLY